MEGSKPRARLLTITGLVITFAFAVAGCAGQAQTPGGADSVWQPNTSQTVRDGFPWAGPDGGFDIPLDVRLLAAWTAQPGYMYLTTWGSSSCPSIASGTIAQPDGTIVITTQRTGGDTCTADSSPTTSTVQMPDGADNGHPINARVGDGVNATSLTILPRTTPGTVGPISPPFEPIRLELVTPTPDSLDPPSPAVDSGSLVFTAQVAEPLLIIHELPPSHDTAPLIYPLDDGILVQLAGSSSCPPTIDLAEMDAAGELTILVTPLPRNTPCTRDYVPITYLLTPQNPARLLEIIPGAVDFPAALKQVAENALVVNMWNRSPADGTQDGARPNRADQVLGN